jgi:hypothetical protein
MEFSKSVYIVITTHGYIPIDPFQLDTEFKTFEVPDDINILSVIAAPPGVVNTTCYRSIDKFTNIIAAGFEQMDDNQKEHIEELDILAQAVDSIRQEIKKEDAKLFRDYSKHYQIEVDKDIMDMQHAADSRYGMSLYTPGSDMLNKRFEFNIEDSKGYWLNNKIQLFNLPNQDEDFDILEAIIEQNPSINRDKFQLSLSSIIKLLQNKGIVNIAIFDFSCSVLEDDLKLINDREVRKLRRGYNRQKERFTPYGRKKPFSGGVTRRLNKRKNRRTIKRRKHMRRTKRRRHTKRTHMTSRK